MYFHFYKIIINYYYKNILGCPESSCHKRFKFNKCYTKI